MIPDLAQLESRLSELSPIHDTPVGVLHPYWARKPLNVVSAIVESLSEPCNLVADPFAGSGTTAWASLSQGRSCFVSDLSPLATLIIKAIAALRTHGDESVPLMKDFLSQFKSLVTPMYTWEGARLVERERFDVSGDFDYGNFALERSSVVLKRNQNGVWRGRQEIDTAADLYDHAPSPRYLADPIDFQSVHLRYNSRIAIPQGARLSHFFTPRNQAAINIALSLIESLAHTQSSGAVLQFLLSSALPLLRLSDAKASSQWPYWRPKSRLTSRNPVMIVEKRAKAICTARAWMEEALPAFSVIPSTQLTRSSPCTLAVETLSAQDVVGNALDEGSVDLLLTDPPYFDQAPYLEYSQLWAAILGLGDLRDLEQLEIVHTDAPDRTHDSAAYSERLSSAFASCARLVSQDGWMVWFYQDPLERNWASLLDAADLAEMQPVGVLGIPKQRRSMKTVTSPGLTLDGDLIVVFRRRSATRGTLPRGFEVQSRRLPERSLDASQEYFWRACSVIRAGLVGGCFRGRKTSNLRIRDIVAEWYKEG